ncbi:glycerophosphodiester phosphodiesterase family protein [[Clostridium] dakarense]|uniref:glycerophosphodiester phosphodiesterase family protein n=1 Tax=Faecalimicrobium dakarense TaxID=1301100 RepID=UPI0004BB50F3|nr:glycerophosphodiester phosphodiesterase family protein [[Clostridium] dakarense]
MEKYMDWIKEIPIAHRGLYNEKYPENSIGAFKNAANHKYSIELDIQFTKDKKIVVFHDSNLYRMTKDERNIYDVNYEDIKELRLLNSDEKIPTIEEVLEVVNGKVGILIEIKNSKNIFDLCEELYNIVKSYDGKYSIQSFNPFVLVWYKNNANHILRGQIAGLSRYSYRNLSWCKKFALKNMILNFKTKPDYIAYSIKGIDKPRITYLRNKGILIISWTIKNEKDMIYAYKYSDNIIFEGFYPPNKKNN